MVPFWNICPQGADCSIRFTNAPTNVDIRNSVTVFGHRSSKGIIIVIQLLLLMILGILEQ
jgi:hypothetical protein